MSQWQNRSYKPFLVTTENEAVTLQDTVWDDLVMPLTRERQGLTGKPDFDFTNFGLLFPQNDPTEIAYLTRQMKHKWAIGTDIHPHVHFVQNSALQPTFKMDYRVIQNNGATGGSFTTLTAVVFKFAYTSGSILQIAEFPTIDTSAITTVSAQWEIRLYRDDDVVTGDVLGKEFDLHYQIDSLGSKDEYTK